MVSSLEQVPLECLLIQSSKASRHEYVSNKSLCSIVLVAKHMNTSHDCGNSLSWHPFSSIGVSSDWFGTVRSYFI